MLLNDILLFSEYWLWGLKMNGYDFEDAEDEELIRELKSSKKRQKDFIEVINRKRLNRHELDEVMV